MAKALPPVAKQSRFVFLIQDLAKSRANLI
jgi:hypothetical protein